MSIKVKNFKPLQHSRETELSLPVSIKTKHCKFSSFLVICNCVFLLLFLSMSGCKDHLSAKTGCTHLFPLLLVVDSGAAGVVLFDLRKQPADVGQVEAVGTLFGSFKRK
jgi:hypothetical protein